MAKKYSIASKYESRYGGGYVSASQILAELMCERQARLKNIDLTDRFWKDPFWEKQFLRQLREANNLLKLYSKEAISLALRSKQGKKIYSLGFKNLDDLIKVEQEKINKATSLSKEENVTNVEQVDNNLPKTRKDFVKKKSTMDKLEGL